MIVGGILPIARPMLARIRQPLAPAPNLNVEYILSQKSIAELNAMRPTFVIEVPQIFQYSGLSRQTSFRTIVQGRVLSANRQAKPVNTVARRY